MAMATASANISSTPKRKRGEETWASPIQFTFVHEPLSSSFHPSSVPTPADTEDGSDSSRSRVLAHKFRGLALESGGGATVSNEDSDNLMDEDKSMRKRQKPDEIMSGADAAPTVQEVVDLDGKSVLPSKEPLQPFKGRVHEEPQQQKQNHGSLHHAYPSINRLSESKSRVKKRTGSPPLRMKRPSRRPFEDPDEEEVQIVDPVRAALTWHEDEITIYDPDDEDDDGIGINGIGFKPTPALAHARAMRRRQQMAEYRKREESEARARRSQRRGRGSGVKFGRSEEQSPPRKVRFTDTEASNIAITTG
ncbi:hypothetical protein FOCG_06899 [Fusarium oxysporum f. sp. radicis-lycopersici 26381]|uniref:Uncharacterized protein n=4 Tax=Fusarium oxysporum TaxID=5507 RepID=A0A2H3HP87_FUSOX|nr:uncharacterized protein FOBCDRAFT_17859 [Fusarium oxysporum Fo47]EWZ93444.1 hypothetical protein FOWG_06196 [Fusarium oxysporum f. sp. lycopersici MN25]EXL53703.1 hypothetical protein FOCG_06899 [Fusarium oxysporum f. sp. radicis-lycopersici 26381]PCD41534.1 hypothetical protein AU210_004082 [Fusarium oxysporum f. sp. radicis-cucumerinum]RKK25771.1 hypothetical protein BFJ65_g3673 [Fusarium oxysporum f. sp. cepae]RKK81560.1 hypothetical protein BFJ71_g15562 [Fusarium oxysporum]